MKKALRQEFYEQMHTILPDLYQKAYALKGNKIEAEMLTENILLRGAKQFSALANKARFRDILLQKIETGTHMDLEATDLDALAARVMEKIEKKDNIKKMVWGVCAGVLSVGIFVTVIIPNFPSNIPDEQTTPEATTAKDVNGEIINPTLPVIGEVTMRDTKTIKGDNKVIFFENYHNLSLLLNKKTTIDTPQDELSLLERLCDSVIAPDGTAYMVYNNVVKEDDSNITFTLYRMEVDGWTEVAIGEAQGCYYENAIVEQYYASRINLVSDKDSNIYVLVLLDDCVTIYKYDAKIGVFKKCDSTLPCMKPMNEPTFTIYYDEHAGEKGRIYIGYWKQYKLGFAYYDIAKDGFEIITENIGTVMEKYAIFCVKNETIYAVTQGNDSGKRILTYYQIESDGTFIKNRLFTSKGSWDIESEDIYNRKVGSGGIHVDETGVIHIVASHFDGGMHVDCSTYLVHYMIDTNGNVTKQELPQHYYNDYTEADRFARYDPICALFFVGKKGEMYYIESYDSTENLLVVCELNQEICGESRCVDVIELPDNISEDRIRINQGAVVFYSDAQHILFFKLIFQN